jgi:hypothetical protein
MKIIDGLSKEELDNYITGLSNKIEAMENRIKSDEYNRDIIIKDTVGKCIMEVNKFINEISGDKMSDKLLERLQNIYKNR